MSLSNSKIIKYFKKAIAVYIFLFILLPLFVSAAGSGSSWDGPTPTGPGQYDANGNFILNFDDGSKTVTSPSSANGNHSVTNYNSSGNQVYTETLGANGLQNGYVPLANLPNVSNSSSGDLSGYLQNVFVLGVSIATGLAVIMIVVGGIQYMSTDAIGGKTEGREKIASALWGLLIALASYIILNTINPKLLNTNLVIPTQTGSIYNSPDYINSMENQVGFFNSGSNSSAGGTVGSSGLGFNDPSLYTGLNNSPISSVYQDDNGNMIFNYQDGSEVIQYWDDNGPTGSGEFYNSDGDRVVGGQVVSYVDYSSDGTPIYHFENGSTSSGGNQFIGSSGNYSDIHSSGVVSGRATTFGYNDSEDNGVGNYLLDPNHGNGINTNNAQIQGVALPPSVLQQQLGVPAYNPNADQWAAYAPARNAGVEVFDNNGNSNIVHIVDLGPGSGPISAGVVIDETYAENQYFGGTDARSYKIIPCYFGC